MQRDDDSWQTPPQSPWWKAGKQTHAEPVASETELRELASDIVKYSESGLMQILLAFAPKGTPNPLHSMN